MRSYTVAIEAHHVGEETGRWCDACLLPSVSLHRFALTVAGGVQVFGRVLFEACDGCGRMREVDGG